VKIEHNYLVNSIATCLLPKWCKTNSSTDKMVLRWAATYTITSIEFFTRSTAVYHIKKCTLLIQPDSVDEEFKDSVPVSLGYSGLLCGRSTSYDALLVFIRLKEVRHFSRVKYVVDVLKELLDDNLGWEQILGFYRTLILLFK